MKKLTLIRHAKSSWDNPGLSDEQRPLNLRGERDAPFMARKMVERNWQPELIISSPAVRALTTAKYFATALARLESDIRIEGRIYEANVLTVSYLIKELDEKWNDVVLFGHNPAFTWFAQQYAGVAHINNVPTCGIIEIESAPNASWADLAAGKGEAVQFHYPKQYFS